MGGYGAFVWPAYGVTAAVLLALLVDSLRRLKAGQRALARLEAQLPKRRERRGDVHRTRMTCKLRRKQELQARARRLYVYVSNIRKGQPYNEAVFVIFSSKRV